MTTVEELQSALDRAKEKLQENSHTLSENDKEIAKLNSDVETVSDCTVLCSTCTENDTICESMGVCVNVITLVRNRVVWMCASHFWLGCGESLVNFVN